MYLTGRSPYLDSSLLCSNYRNIIRVIPLGNHSTAETVRSLYLSILPSLSTESTVLTYKAPLHNYYLVTVSITSKKS
jgi:hypothetical protein